MLPVVGETQIDQRLQKGIPDALLSPAPEPDIDRVPLAVSLVHVAPWAASPQYVKHAIEKAPIILGGARPAPSLKRKQRPDQFPLRIQQITATHDCSSKSSLESEPGGFGNPLVTGGIANPDMDLPHRIFRTRSFVEDDTTIPTQIDSIF